MKEKENTLEDEIFKLTIFVLSSAKILYDEPPSYGPNRLFTVFKKIASLSSYCDEPDEKAFWGEIRDTINSMRDNDIKDVLDVLLSKFLKESMKRG
jgi:hypothetical protein